MIDFERLFAELPSPYMVLDAQMNFVAANKAYEATVKMSSSRLIGQNLFVLFPNDGSEGDRLRRSIRKVLDTGKSDTLAFIPYATPRPEAEGGGFEERYWTAVHTPLNDDRGRTAFVLQNTVDVTDLFHSRKEGPTDVAEASGGIHVLQRAREVERAYERSLAESAEFRLLFTQAPGMIAVLSGPDHRFSFANDAYRRFAWDRTLDGLSISEVFPEIVDQGFTDLLDSVYRTGRPERGEGVRIILNDSESDAPREAYLDFSYQPIRDGEGRISGVFVQGTDRTDQYRTLHRQRLLLDELNHRVKNTLSTVQSIARRSFRDADRRGLDAFEARIKALSNVHDIISDRHWEKIGLGALLDQELAALGATRAASGGPMVALTPRAAIALAMVFHELASNAVKYGALAFEEGVLAVAWSIAPGTDGGRLTIEWREEGNASSPSSWPRGLGMRTLERVVKGELDGSFTLESSAGGLICRIGLSVAEVGEVGE